MSKNSISLMAVFCLFLCGCITTGKFTRTLSSNWDMSREEARKKLNITPAETEYLGSSVSFQRYKFFDPWTGPKDIILYFKDDQLVRYAGYSESNHYESMYELGVISIYQYKDYDEDYRIFECVPGPYGFYYFWGYGCRYDGGYGGKCGNW